MRKNGPVPPGYGENRAIPRCQLRPWGHQSLRPPPCLARFSPATLPARICRYTLAVFAVEKVADGAAASGVDFNLDAALGGVKRAALVLLGLLRLTARRAAIGEAGLAGAELKFITAGNTGLDRKRHRQIC